MADIRKDFLHKLTAEVAMIQVEGLSLQGMAKAVETEDVGPGVGRVPAPTGVQDALAWW